MDPTTARQPTTRTTVVIVLDGERPKSGNNSYAGQPHWKRTKEKNRVYKVVRAGLPNELMELDAFNVPVMLHMDVYVKKNPIDASNALIKMYEDALVHYGILIDDDIKHVVDVGAACHIDPLRPRVEITITPVPQETTQ